MYQTAAMAASTVESIQLLFVASVKITGSIWDIHSTERRISSSPLFISSHRSMR